QNSARHKRSRLNGYGSSYPNRGRRPLLIKVGRTSDASHGSWLHVAAKSGLFGTTNRRTSPALRHILPMLVTPKTRVAFDLDETLGVPMITSNAITGFHARPGCIDLLRELRDHYFLVLWSVSKRSYVDKALAGGLAAFFAQTYSWDEMPCEWKDIRRI